MLIKVTYCHTQHLCEFILKSVYKLKSYDNVYSKISNCNLDLDPTIPKRKPSSSHPYIEYNCDVILKSVYK